MKNKLISLLAGPTDKTKIFRFGIIKPEEYETYLRETSETLIKHIESINIIPDEGVPLDLAKSFRIIGGAVIGYFPKGTHNQFYRNFIYCSDVEEFDSGWFGLNTCLSLRGDIIIALGLSPGTMVEISYTKYHMKYLKRELPVLLDMRTITNRIPIEVSEDIDLRYFSNNKELDSNLSAIRSER